MLPMVLSITDRLNELNEKINAFTADKLDNVFIGTVIFAIILAVTFWGIGELNKKN